METMARQDLAVDGRLKRPFHFAVVLWGERFRNYFLEYCLPSLLSDGNIPSLATQQSSKFLIATLPDDWASMAETAVFRRLERYVEPVFVEIPPCPPGRDACEHIGIGHKLMCEMSFREKAYAVHATPDCMFSDGAIACAQALARNGTELVVCAALRFSEEPVFRNLYARGILPQRSARDSGESLTLPPRDLVWAAINGLHLETLSYEWDGPYFVLRPAAVWWNVPNEDGIVVHCLSWFPLLLDFAAVRTLDTSMLDYWTIDGDFLHRNIDAGKAIHVVDDSDEAFVVSWTPAAERAPSARPIGIFKNAAVREAVHAVQLRRTYYGPYIDPLKRRLFLRTVRWHSRPLTDAWKLVERNAQRTLGVFIHEMPGAGPSDTGGWAWVVRIASAIMSIAEPVVHIWLHHQAVRRRLSQILQGNTAAARRVFWHVQRVAYEFVGRPFNKPAPRPPT